MSIVKPLRLLATIALSFVATDAVAEKLKLICKNPRQEYLVVFDTTSNRLIVNPDTDNVAYAVTSARRSEDGLVVRGQTRDGGPTFSVFFGDGAAMTFGEHQVDPCRPVMAR